MVIDGFRLKTSDLNEVFTTLEGVKERLHDIMNHEYHILLAEEVAFICDNVAMNNMPIDTNNAIIDNAIGNLQFKITNASKTNSATKYNFNIFAHIMPFGDETYIKVISPNRKLLASFLGIEKYSLNESEAQNQDNAKTKRWEELHTLYKDSEPFLMKLTQEPFYDSDITLQYPDKRKRAETHARHTIVNHLLNEISGYNTISPMMLMPYMDMALEMLERPDIQADYRRKVTNLMQILPDLDKDDTYVFEKKYE